MSCRFTCQQRVLKTFPDRGYLWSEDGLVWLWYSLSIIYICNHENNVFSQLSMALLQLMHLGTWCTVHVPRRMSFHKAIVVITGRAHCFHDYTHTHRCLTVIFSQMIVTCNEKLQFNSMDMKRWYIYNMIIKKNKYRSGTLQHLRKNSLTLVNGWKLLTNSTKSSILGF